MADRYWVGGTGTWDETDTNNWSATSGGAGGASVPTSADNVIFNNDSSNVPFTVDVDGFVSCLNLTIGSFFSGGVMTFDGNAAFNVYIYGSLSYPATNLVASIGSEFVFSSTTTGRTITTNGVSFNNDIRFVGVGGSWTLVGALTTTDDIEVTNGTFNTGNYAISCRIFSITGSNTRTVTLGSSAITCTYSSPGASFESWNAATVTNLTFTANTATITLSGANANFAGGTLTYSTVIITSTGSGDVYFSGQCTIGSLTLAAPAATGIKTIEFAANITITTLVASGASVIRRLLFTSSSSTASRTITNTTWTTKTDIDFQNITASGTAWSGTRLGDGGGNSNITFAAAKTVYWNLGGSVLWSATGWATTSGGTPAINNFPLAHDTIIFNNTGTASTVTINAAWLIGALDMSARTSAMTLGATSAVKLLMDVTLGTGVTVTGSITASVGYANSLTLTTNGVSIPWKINIDHVVALGSSLTCTNTLDVNAYGNFSAGVYAVTVDSFITDAASVVSLGSATWTITGLSWRVVAGTTFTKGTANIVLSNATTTQKEFDGGGKTYNNLTFGASSVAANLLFDDNNTFATFESQKTVAHTLRFTSASTNTFNQFIVNSSSGNLVTLAVDTTGTFNIVKSGGGTNAISFASISNSAATPARTWYAISSTDNGGNSGWFFGAIPRGFLIFFM